MAIDPSIAMSFKPTTELNLQPTNLLAQYGQLAAIQNAQNQNALAQYQLESARRQDVAQNVLNKAWQEAISPEGKVDYNRLIGTLAAGGAGGQIPGVQKMRTEEAKAATEEAARRAKLVVDKTAMYRDMVGSIASRDDAISWLQTQLSDPDMAGSPVTKVPLMQAVARIPTDPAALEQWKTQQALGMTKFTELNKPHYMTENLGSESRVTALPGLGGAPTTISTTARTATPGELLVNARALERNAIERQKAAQDATGVVYQEDAQGNIVALPSKLKKGEVPTARVAVAPGGGLQPLQAKPSEAVGKELMSINQQKSILNGAIAAVDATPNAFGWPEGSMPESLRGRWEGSEENKNRAFLFNVVSGVIKERAGTAQSPAEKATLERFLPIETDDARVIKNKLEGYQKYLAAKEAGTTKQKTGIAPGRELSTIDRSALEWANANPNDPRATQIKQRLGVQ